MSEPRPDDERLSALIDGRLQGAQRDELLAHLADDDDDYQLFVDSADILHELEEEDAREQAAAHRGAHPPSMGTGRRRWPRGAPRWIAIPVILAGFAVLGIFALRGRASMLGPVDLAARLPGAQQGLPPDFTPERPWLIVRGGDGPEERNARAAQAGVLLVDLSIAVASGDSADIERRANQIWRRFDEQAVSSSPIRQIAVRAGERTSLQPLVRQATERLEEKFGRDHLRLGAWTEAGLLAVRRRDEAFFRSRATRAALRRAEDLTGEDPEAQAALARIRTAAAARGAPDWEGLNADLEAFQGAIAS